MGADSPSSSSIPQQYFVAKQRWECEISIENADRIVDEYTITPDCKLFLNDFLDVVREEIAKFDGGAEEIWGVKIYRITQKR